MLTILALGTFNKRLIDDADTLLMETGDPNHLTRHAIGTLDGQITFMFDTVDGPKAGGTELMDVAIFPDANGAMLVTSQLYTADVRRLITDGTNDAIGWGIYGKYEATGGAKFSALGDPELDGKSGVFFYTKDKDGKYLVKGVGKQLQGYTVDGDKSLVYKGGDLLLVDTLDFLDALRKNAISSLGDAAMKVETVGEGAKLARAATIEIGDEKKKVWAYVQSDGDQNTVYFLDYETLETLAMQTFKGTYATPSVDGKEMVFVSHSPAGEDIDTQPEKFEVQRGPFAAQPNISADAAQA